MDRAALLLCGLGFKAKLVEQFFTLERNQSLFTEIGKLEASAIYRELVSLHGVGHWTASVAVATYTGNWSLYPCEDLAVRTWASKILAKCDWPNAPDTFEARWRERFGEHVGAATLLLLACGSFCGDRVASDSGTRSGTGSRRGVRELTAERL
jgi:3-methyladenine DNA glycosylase/8-oxoguanine DNA glycosylase